MTVQNRNKGSKAEDLAEQFLTSLGFIIIQKNFHYGRYGEIDLVARDGDTLVFVEVKARSSDRYGTAIQAITPKKITHLRLAAEGYRQMIQDYTTECRFDVVTLDYESGAPRIHHYPNAF